MNGNIAFLPFGYLSPNSFLYLLCFSTAHFAICTIENTVKIYAVQFLVNKLQKIHPRAYQKQFAELTWLKPNPQGIFLSFETFTYSLSSFCFGDRLKSPMILWHLQFNNSTTVHSPTRIPVVVVELLCPEGKRQSSIELKSPKRTQQWKLLIRTLLKGIDSLLKTCTQAVSYYLFKKWRTPKTKAVVCTSVYASFLPSKKKIGSIKIGPRYSIQKTISHRICLPRFFRTKFLSAILAILIGISLSLSTCLVSPSLQESSCWRTGILVNFLISSLMNLMVLDSSAVILSVSSLQTIQKLIDISCMIIISIKKIQRECFQN